MEPEPNKTKDNKVNIYDFLLIFGILGLLDYLTSSAFSPEGGRFGIVMYAVGHGLKWIIGSGATFTWIIGSIRTVLDLWFLALIIGLVYFRKHKKI